MTRARLFVFARAPIHGQVKTRLAAGIGADAALQFYREMLARTLARLDDPRWSLTLAVTPDGAKSPDWPDGVPRLDQGDGDLGARMGRLLDHARPDAPVLIVGSDIPALQPGHVARALDALADAALVLGPASDGGYWLIGGRHPPPPPLFDAVRWSTEHALADTLRNAGPDVALVDTLDDVDDAAGYLRWRGA